MLWDYFSKFFKRQALEKGTWRFEYLKLLWDYFSIFFRKQALKKGVCRFEIALGVFSGKKIGGKPGKRESADLRLPWDYF